MPHDFALCKLYAQQWQTYSEQYVAQHACYLVVALGVVVGVALQCRHSHDEYQSYCKQCTWDFLKNQFFDCTGFEYFESTPSQSH